MTGARWWSRTRGLPPEQHRSWTAALAERPAAQPRVLAWATTGDGYVVASPSALAVGGPAGWTTVGWHEIERGGWDSATGLLGWTEYDGSATSVELTAAGRVPEVFRERVAASIVLEELVPLVNRRGVLVSGRRDLAGGDPGIEWHTTLQRGLTWHTPGVQEGVEEALRRVRAEYDVEGAG